MNRLHAALLLFVALFTTLATCQDRTSDRYMKPPQPDPEYFQKRFLQEGVAWQVEPMTEFTAVLVGDIRPVSDAGVEAISSVGWHISPASPRSIRLMLEAVGRAEDGTDLLKITVQATETTDQGGEPPLLGHPKLAMKVIRLPRNDNAFLLAKVEEMSHVVATALLRECLQMSGKRRMHEIEREPLDERLN